MPPADQLVLPSALLLTLGCSAGCSGIPNVKIILRPDPGAEVLVRARHKPLGYDGTAKKVPLPR